ncbi:MAG: class A beta-lactamase-related serine hydrolase [Actinomycetia bacterium]|nr:class A beta-lactamase-related serine hydrolase [Actinomycetes bacterium]
MTTTIEEAHATLDDLAKRNDAAISVWMGALDGTPWLVRDAEREHPAASTMKLPLLIAIHRAAEAGELSLDDTIPVHEEFSSVVPDRTFRVTEDYDNDPVPWAELGNDASIAWLGERAIILSSNLATNLLIEQAGIPAVNAVYDAAGATTSRLRQCIQDLPAQESGTSNTATAEDMARVLVSLLADQLTPTARTQEIERVLAACETNEAIPAGLPAGTYIAHKTGWIDGACHDAALVRPDDAEPFILSIYSGADLGEDDLHSLVAEAAARCWDARPIA